MVTGAAEVEKPQFPKRPHAQLLLSSTVLGIAKLDVLVVVREAKRELKKLWHHLDPA